MANDVRFEFAATTDIGRVRLQNEDCVAISASHGFAILADGMGGYSAGEVASSIAVEVVKSMLERELAAESDGGQASPEAPRRSVEQLLNDAIQAANMAIMMAANAEAGHAGMGTTIVVAVFDHGAISIAHVGDSRAYCLRRGKLAQLTRDHSLLQEQIDAGLIHPEWARYAQNKNLVTRAVGVGYALEVDVKTYPVEAGDLYLLCSDGLSDMLTLEEMNFALAERSPSLQASCSNLIKRANENGGYDNVSVVLMRESRSLLGDEPSLFDRIWNWFL